MYQAVLLQKPLGDGLTRDEIERLLSMLPENSEVFPLEIEAHHQECTAMGFITTESADISLDYDYDGSGFNDFVANILDDMENEREDCTYNFQDKFQVYLGY